MLRNRLCYGLVLLGTGLFFLCYNGYVSYFVFLLSLLLPVVSLVLSLPGMLTMRLSLSLDSPDPYLAHLRKGEAVTLRLGARCPWPFTGSRVKLRLAVRNTLTGEERREWLVLVPSRKALTLEHSLASSTCGLVDKIYDLADKKLQLTLSVSLHAPNDEIRSRTMPVNKRWNMEQLLKACKYYSTTTGRRISFEYAMISGVNDMDWCARELASRLRGILAHVNLIPVNDVTGTGYKKSGIPRQKRFVALLEERGVTATVRRTLGSDIEASCGQLRRKVEGGTGHES